MTRAYYNENDAHAAQWLRNLIARRLIPDGVVDERSITDVRPKDLKGFTQCSFFAGISGWSLALQRAGWPADREIWSGSCPCQPFSHAGRRRGTKDARHLWPEFRRLIAARRPAAVCGEQVASRLGRDWLAGVRADLAHLGYDVWAADLGAACIAAPHRRQRLFWMAYPQRDRVGQRPRDGARAARPAEGEVEEREWRRDDAWRSGRAGRMADGAGAGRGRAGRASKAHAWAAAQPHGRSNAGRVGHPDGERQQVERTHVRPWGPQQDRTQARGAGTAGRLGDANAPGLPTSEREAALGPRGRHEGRATSQPGRASRGVADAAGAELRSVAPAGHERGNGANARNAARGPWSDYALIPCADGKARRAQRGLPLLASGVPFVLADGRTREGASRIQLIKGFGNAIVPPLAAIFVRAFLEAERSTP